MKSLKNTSIAWQRYVHHSFILFFKSLFIIRLSYKLMIKTKRERRIGNKINVYKIGIELP